MIASPIVIRILGGVGIIVALGIGVKVWTASIRSDERANVVAEYRDASQKAEIAQLRKNLETERRQNEVTRKANEDQVTQMAAANSQLSAYVARLRSKAAGNPGAVPGASNAPLVFDGPDQETLLDDLAICTENTVRLENGQGWVRGQAEVSAARE